MHHFNKMGTVALFTVLCFLLYSPVQGDPELSFNTTKFEESTYYAPIGKTVALTCIVPRAARQVLILKRTMQSNGKWRYIRFVENGDLSENADDRKYSFELSGNNNCLVIHNITESDTSKYRCTFNVRKCSRPIKGKRRCRRHPTRKTVSLEVKKNSNMSSSPEFCDLVSDTDGIYFVGDDLTLRCPKKVSNITANGSNILTNVTDDGKYFKLVTIQSLTEKYNATKITCSCLQDACMSEDCCRHLPSITVFYNLTVTVSPVNATIPQGGHANFSCQSYPFLANSFEWDIPLVEDDNISWNANMSDTLGGSRLVIDNTDFRTSNSPSLSLICTATIGSRNKSQTAIVFLQNSTYTTENRDNNKSSGIASFVIPMMVCLVLVILGTVMSGFFYDKVRRHQKRKDEAKNVDVTQNFENMERHPNQTEKDMKAQLGLSGDDSEVMENVAYMSYDEAF